MVSPSEFQNQYLSRWQNTPLVENEGILFKCEGENPTGSIKARGLARQIFHLLEKNISEAVISSSGNAALAGAFYAQKAGITLHVFVPKNIEQTKINQLNSYGARLNLTDSAINDAIEFAEKNNLTLIRQSLDITASEGFRFIVDELLSDLQSLQLALKDVSIFFPVSSGTTVKGFFEGLQESFGENLSLYPQIHIVQTEAVNLIAGRYDHDFKRKARSIVTGIVARKADNIYFDEVVKAVDVTKGSGWVVSDKAVALSHHWLLDHGIDASLAGAMAHAGYQKAKQKNFSLRRPLVILT